ncbi:MAG: hypothetical protein ACREGH_00235 [Minisyncoccia bacterium]
MRTTIAVIRGGPHEYDASIQTGAAFLQALDTDRYEPRDVVISLDNLWHRSGVAVNPERALRGADAVVNCVHGRYGQDGWLTHLIGTLGYRVLGSSLAPAAVAFDRVRSRSFAPEAGLAVPQHRIIARTADPRTAALELFRTFPMPAVVKPIRGALSPKAIVVSDLKTLEHLLTLALGLAPKAMVEEYIVGKPISIGVLEGLDGQPARMFFSTEVPEPVRGILAKAAHRMHEQLNLRHLSESHFIINSRAPWYIKTDALPELGRDTSFVRGLESEGIGMPAFADHAVRLAIEG